MYKHIILLKTALIKYRNNGYTVKNILKYHIEQYGGGKEGGEKIKNFTNVMDSLIDFLENIIKNVNDIDNRMISINKLAKITDIYNSKYNKIAKNTFVTKDNNVNMYQQLYKLWNIFAVSVNIDTINDMTLITDDAKNIIKKLKDINSIINKIKQKIDVDAKNYMHEFNYNVDDIVYKSESGSNTNYKIHISLNPKPNIFIPLYTGRNNLQYVVNEIQNTTKDNLNSEQLKINSDNYDIKYIYTHIEKIKIILLQQLKKTNDILNENMKKIDNMKKIHIINQHGGKLEKEYENNIIEITELIGAINISFEILNTSIYNRNIIKKNSDYYIKYLIETVTLEKITSLNIYKYIDNNIVNYYKEIIEHIDNNINKTNDNISTYFRTYHINNIKNTKKFLTFLIENTVNENIKVIDIKACKGDVQTAFYIFNYFKDILEKYKMQRMETEQT